MIESPQLFKFCCFQGRLPLQENLPPPPYLSFPDPESTQMGTGHSTLYFSFPESTQIGVGHDAAALDLSDANVRIRRNAWATSEVDLPPRDTSDIWYDSAASYWAFNHHTTMREAVLITMFVRLLVNDFVLATIVGNSSMMGVISYLICKQEMMQADTWYKWHNHVCVGGPWVGEVHVVLKPGHDDSAVKKRMIL